MNMFQKSGVFDHCCYCVEYRWFKGYNWIAESMHEQSGQSRLEYPFPSHDGTGSMPVWADFEQAIWTSYIEC